MKCIVLFYSGLYEEAERYKDLVIIDFEDTYRNMTLKCGLGIKWAAKFCPGVFKTLIKLS